MNGEVEFRLLFTPVAQTQMLNLMKDTKVGYGDVFTFIKQRKVNVLMSEHLSDAPRGAPRHGCRDYV